MENNKKNLAKIALTALLLAAAAPAGVSAADKSTEGTFLAAGCSSCGGKRGQLADNACGGRRASAPQSSSCGAQRAPIADSSCGGRRANAPQSSSCGAVRNFTADNSTQSNMYDTTTHSYQTTPPADHPYGAPNDAAMRGTGNPAYQGNPNAMQNQNMNNPNMNNPNANFRRQNPNNPNQAQQGNPYSNPNSNPNNYGN